MERMFGLSHLQIYDLQHSGGGVSSVHDDRSILKLAGQNILGKFIKSPEPLPAVCLNHQSLNNVIAMNLTNEQIGKFAKGNDNKKNGSGVPRKPVNRSQSTKSGKISNKSSNCNSNSDKLGKNNNNNSNNNNNNNTKKSNVEETSPQGKTTNTLVDSTKSNNNGSSSATEINANTAIANPSADSLKRKSPSIIVSAVGGPPKTEIDMQKQKYIKVISFLNQHNQRLELELTLEKRRRAEELSRIIKSLLCFEAKLKHDKKVINRRLYEKDTEISKLLTLNKMLRKRYAAVAVVVGATADSAADDLEADLMNAPGGEFEALNCPNCRKDFYELTGKDVWTQTFTDERSSNEDHTENGSSSDETVSSSFYGARRSVRYTSKRNFRDYMRSRCMAIDHPSLNNSEENMSTLSRDDSNNSTYEKTNAFSRKIERLHGVRRIESFTDDIDSEIELNRRNRNKSNIGGDYESDEMFMPIKSRSYRIKKFAETSPKQEFEASTDDWYASASDVDDSENLRAKPYGYNAVNPVLECVNQILLQQSMDECAMDGPPSLESSENTSGSGGSSQRGDGTVSRKRVHFSIKNSMVHVPRDDRIPPPSRNVSAIDSNEQQKDCNLNYESIYSNEYERIGSEHNSSNLYVDMESKLGQEDRIVAADKAKKPPALPPKPANLIKFKRVLKITPHPVSIKEDEPKIDGEQKNAAADELDANDDDGEEPDYCSISEVNEAITSVQIVADVHKSADDDISSNSSEPALSQKTDEVEEIFADIPKLPNVAAIIVPKPVNKFITTDNYILKEATTTTMSMGQPTKSPHIPNILAEINKKANSANNSQQAILSTPPTTPSKSSMNLPISLGSPSKILSVPPEDKLPLQAEFDWYNLDVEYGKSNQPDVIKETDVTTLEYHQMVTVNESDELEDDPDDIGIGGVGCGGVLDDDRILMSPEHSVEYKLDEEFCLINQPDIIKENVFDAKTVCNGFATVSDESPGHQQIDKVKINRKNFKNFMDTSGLSTKPLPRQRKIYFSGPFV